MQYLMLFFGKPLNINQYLFKTSGLKRTASSK